MTIEEYMLKMKGFADNLNSAGQNISDDELVLYVREDLAVNTNQLWSTLLLGMTRFHFQNCNFLYKLMELQHSTLSSKAQIFIMQILHLENTFLATSIVVLLSLGVPILLQALAVIIMVAVEVLEEETELFANSVVELVMLTPSSSPSLTP